MNRNSSVHENINIHRIIEDGSIIIHFQPIISIKRKMVIGFEGLTRGVSVDSKVISPIDLFTAAEHGDRLLDLDRLCRRKIIAAFKDSFYHSTGRQIIFINFETSVLDDDKLKNGHFMDLCSEFHISPHNVAIEIKESAVRNIKALKNFVETYRYYGFHIAIDDVGAGHSNFARIPLIKPDVIKVDRAIIRNIDRDYYKQEVFRSLVNLSRKIGSLLLAEGVETEAESLFCLEFGADLLQGYHISKPKSGAELRIHELNKKTYEMADNFTLRMTEKIRSIKKQHENYDEIVTEISKYLAKLKKPSEFDSRLKTIIANFVSVDAIYLIDEHGVQVTDTHLNYDISRKSEGFFEPAKKGDDHSLKEYYFLPSNLGFKKYTTKSYTSLATGNVCRTIAIVFRDASKNKYVLCVDFKEDRQE